MNTQTLPWSPAADRNREPILNELRQRLPRGARVLEIGSGTGQHAVAFAAALPELVWQASEMPGRISALSERLALEGRGKLAPALELDVTHGPWPAGPFDAFFSANTAHIMSWDSVCVMLARVADLMGPESAFYLYGPFSRKGEHTAPSNAAFDHQLRSADPQQGIRDLNDLEMEAARHQLELTETLSLPANNLLLVLRKDD